MKLSFATLRAANLKRLPLFNNAKGEPAHSKPDGSDWDLYQWFEALDGETGEYANYHKKFVRGDLDKAEYTVHAANELADIATYLDIFAYRMGIDLSGPTVVFSFNETRETNLEVVNEAIAAGKTFDFNLTKIYKELKMQIMLAFNSYYEIRNHLSAFHIYNVLVYLDLLAMLQDIDLAEAIVKKFNLVSVRVGCGVFIHNDEVVERMEEA